MRQIILPILIAGFGVMITGLWLLRDDPPTKGAGISPESNSLVGSAPVASTSSPVGARKLPSVAFADWQTEIAPRAIRLVGRFVDPWDQPLAGLELRLSRAPRPFATTDDDGRFDAEAQVDRTPVYLSPGPDIFICGQPLKIDALALPDELLVRATRLVRVEGSVMSEHGRPIPNCPIGFEGPAELIGKTGGRLHYVLFDTSTEADGSFLMRVPSFPGVSVQAPRDYSCIWERQEFPIPLPPPENWQLRLELRDQIITGTVIWANGDPRFLDISVGRNRGSYDTTNGWFSIDMKYARWDAALIAVADGHVPKLLEGVAEQYYRNGRSHPPIDLVLEEAISIRGRVLDPCGKPAVGAWIGLLNPTLPAEFLAKESFLDSEAPVKIDRRGRFEIDGLDDKLYRLRALDPETLAYVDADVTPSSAEDLVLQLPEVRRRVVAGRVLQLDGNPGFAEVSCGVSLPGKDLFARKTQTDIQGWFRLDDLPDQELTIEVSGGRLAPTDFAVPPGDVSGLELPVPRKAQFEIVWPPDTDPPESFTVLDHSGERLPFGIGYHGDLDSTYGSLGWTTTKDGTRRSQGIFVAETAWEIALRRDGKEFLRLPLELKTSRKNRVQP